ncbi:hypothetical protein CDV31_016328 [Fusarium ambrosium]|uniref:Uncharacterized protein n=1 Tax=Fusarium ambrosium TaxID=131363 RepID=A0A428SB09_9HYPO|nr:hypothetical protein CDV31_016328 [Fusarium ambrosium]
MARRNVQCRIKFRLSGSVRSKNIDPDPDHCEEFSLLQPSIFNDLLSSNMVRGGQGTRPGGGFGRGAPQGAKLPSAKLFNFFEPVSVTLWRKDSSRQQQQSGQPAPKKRAALPGTREEAEEKIEYWQHQAEYHAKMAQDYEHLLDEACEHIAKWILKRDECLEVLELKGKISNEMQVLLARKPAEEEPAEKSSGSLSDSPAVVEKA